MYLRTVLHCWVRPFSVQVCTCCICSQMPSYGAIRIDVWHNIEHCMLQCSDCKRIVRICQLIQKALHKPFCHGLSRMLSCYDPNNFLVASWLSCREMMILSLMWMLPTKLLAYSHKTHRAKCVHALASIQYTADKHVFQVGTIPNRCFAKRFLLRYLKKIHWAFHQSFSKN